MLLIRNILVIGLILLLLILEAADSRVKSIYRVVSSEGVESYRFALGNAIETNAEPVFRVVQSRQWPKGLVPVYWVKRNGSIYGLTMEKRVSSYFGWRERL